MSLTSLLKNKKDFQIIFKKFIPKKTEFQTNTLLPAFSNYPVLVENELSNSYWASTSGTAFDYMARIITAKVARKTNEELFENFVAKGGLGKLQSEEKKSIYKKLEAKFNESVDEINKYLCGKYNDYEILIPYVCYLAQFDAVYRTSWRPEKGGKSLLKRNREIEEDVNKLCGYFYKVFIESEIVNENSEIIFNPTFGFWSMMCGGADADIIIDGILYDFKSGKSWGYKWKEVAQICGYYLLYCICMEQEEIYDVSWIRKDAIKKIAFYKARFGIIEEFDVKNFDRKLLANAINELKTFLCDYNIERCKLYFFLGARSEDMKLFVRKLLKIQNELDKKKDEEFVEKLYKIEKKIPCRMVKEYTNSLGILMRYDSEKWSVQSPPDIIDDGHILLYNEPIQFENAERFELEIVADIDTVFPYVYIYIDIIKDIHIQKFKKTQAALLQEGKGK